MSLEIKSWKAIEYHWLLWRWSGIFPPATSNQWRRILHWLYAIVFNIITILSLTIFLIVNAFLSETFDDFCENFPITVSYVVCIIKVVNVFLVREQLLQVIPILEYLDRRIESDKEKKVLENGVSSARKCFVLFFNMLFFGILSSQFTTLFSNQWILSYPTWFPWNWKESRINYLCAYWYQLIGLMIQASQDLCNDTYPQAFLVILSAHMRTLAIRFQRLGEEFANATFEGGSMEANESQDKEMYKKLVACINDHQVLLRLFGIIQKSISITCMAQFFSTGLAQCTLAASILYSGFHLSRMLNILIFICLVTFEIFILCYYGDLVFQENENLSQAIYSCNWMDQNSKFKKSLGIILQRSQQDLIVRAADIIPVNLPTFVTVVKTAYSVFTVLNGFK